VFENLVIVDFARLRRSFVGFSDEQVKAGPCVLRGRDLSQFRAIEPNHGRVGVRR
jgi:hypothetical protein